MTELSFTPLDDLAVLDARGADVVRFLQGQVSHDVTLLAERGGLLAALNNPQGRVIAVLRLLHMGPEHVLVVLPASLAETVLQVLNRYVLRAKVKIADAGATWRVYGLTGPDAAAAASTRLHVALDADGWRQLIVAPRNETLPEAEPASRNAWRLADIEEGIPELHAATSGSFVAQMLNLDLLDAISLTKGCYTGQEVIARAHYRGQVKRRMQRFFTESTRELEPGARVQLDDGRSAQIVMTARADEIGQQFLAVATQPAQGDAPAALEQTSEERLGTVQLPLHYAPWPGA